MQVSQYCTSLSSTAVSFGFSSESKWQSAASELHTMTWGKNWPHRSSKFHKSEINISHDDGDMLIKEPRHACPVFNHVDRSFADLLKVPSVFKYTCLTDMKWLKHGLGLAQTKEDIIVICAEYDVLLRVLEEGFFKDEHCLLTSHPGIGSYESRF